MYSDIALSMIGTKLRALSEEMCLTLQRTSRSLYVKETADFCCAIAGIDGRFIAYPQSIGVSGFVGLNILETVRVASEHEPLAQAMSSSRTTRISPADWPPTCRTSR